MPAVNLLTNVTNAEAGDGGLWGDIGGGQGSAQDENAPLQGLACRGRRVDANLRGFGVGVGARDLSGPGVHFGLWLRTFQPGALNGIDCRLGSSATGPDNTPYSNWRFDGALYPAEGPWIRVWVDPTVARDSGAGTLNLASVQWFAANFDMANVGGNTLNCLVDRVDYGSEGIEISGANGTFAEAETLDATDVLGILRSGVLSGPLILRNGQFDDTNFSIRAGAQPNAASDWVRIELDNTAVGNSVTWGAYFLDGVLITVAGTQGALDLGTGTMLNAPAMTWNASVSFAGSLVAAQTLTAGGANLDGATFTDPAGAVAVAVGNLNQLQGATVSKDPAAVARAVQLDPVTSSVAMDWDVATDGFDVGVTGTNVSTTNTGEEDLLVDVAAGQTLTINVAAGRSPPSVTNTGAGQVDIVAVENVLTVNIDLPGALLLIYDKDSADPQNLGTELQRTPGATLSETFPYSAAKAGDDIVIKIILSGFKIFNRTVELQANSFSFDAILIPETN